MSAPNVDETTMFRVFEVFEDFGFEESEIIAIAGEFFAQGFVFRNLDEEDEALLIKDISPVYPVFFNQDVLVADAAKIIYALGSNNVCIRRREDDTNYAEVLSPDEVREIVLDPDISDIVSPDAPATTNEHGGSQSDIPVRFDLIDAKAMFEMAKVLDHGAKKYGPDNWRLIEVNDHLNHLLMHTFAYLAGDTTDEHLSHILCRATFALGVSLEQSDIKVCP